METPPRYAPASMVELFDIAARKTLVAEWAVLTDIGPNWIGGGRQIHFAVDDQRLDDASPVVARLRDALVALLAIPESTESECIHGEGTIFVVGDTLQVEYEIHRAAPYMYGSTESGTKMLLKLARPE